MWWGCCCAEASESKLKIVASHKYKNRGENCMVDEVSEGKASMACIGASGRRTGLYLSACTTQAA